jgi:AmiR/NasT family two-component response regulator
MASSEPQELRVLVADERQVYSEAIARVVDGLGHEVIATEVETSRVSSECADHSPDVAIVALHDDTDHALELITQIAHQAVCPVMALVEDANPEFVAEAAQRGIFAHLDSADEEELRGAIDVALKRFAEYDRLRTAFERRAQIERAKGVLMERHSIDEGEAFERLRKEARNSRRKLMDVVAETVSGPG